MVDGSTELSQERGEVLYIGIPSSPEAATHIHQPEREQGRGSLKDGEIRRGLLWEASVTQQADRGFLHQKYSKGGSN